MPPERPAVFPPGGRFSPDAARVLLRGMFNAAVAAAQPALCLPGHLPAAPRGRLIVIGAGKAAAAMARTVEAHCPGPLSGLVITRYGHAEPCRRIEVAEAAHPVPDAAGEAATARMLDMVRGLGADDLVLCLISGGGSSLLVAPLPGLTLADKQEVNRRLLASGATIGEMNVVRRHLSAVKGGRLAAACAPARVVTLMISDVPGDDPGTIASGPTVADPTTAEEARAVLDRYGIDLPGVRAVLETAAAESVKPGDPRLVRAGAHVVASPAMALAAAADVARRAGVTPHILSDALEGEAREMGRILGGIARHSAARAEPFAAPCVILSGGEATVTLPAGGQGAGRGGRNVEFLLSLALTLAGAAGIHALAADTDGIDGQEEVAGATLGPDTLLRARAMGLDARAMLAVNDAHSFFEALGDQVVTGPTRTNVNDFRAILIG